MHIYTSMQNTVLIGLMKSQDYFKYWYFINQHKTYHWTNNLIFFFDLKFGIDTICTCRRSDPENVFLKTFIYNSKIFYIDILWCASEYWRGLPPFPLKPLAPFRPARERGRNGSEWEHEWQKGQVYSCYIVLTYIVIKCQYFLSFTHTC